MKCRFLSLLLLLFFSSCLGKAEKSTSIIIDWKGSEINSEALPNWLIELENGHEDEMRKKFDIEGSKKIYFATDQNPDLDMGLGLAKKKILDSHLADIENSSKNIERIFVHWILIKEQTGEESEKEYKVYLVYSCI